MTEVNGIEKLPEGWKRVRLGEVFKDNFSGDWGSEFISGSDSFPVFSTLAINYNGKVEFSKTTSRCIDKKRIEKLKLKKFDILIEKSGGSVDTPAGKVALLKEDFDGTCSNFIQILRVKAEYNSVFLFYRLFYDFINKLTEKYQQRTTGIINFKIKDYFNESILLPLSPNSVKSLKSLRLLTMP